MNIRPSVKAFLEYKYPDKIKIVSTLYMESDSFHSLCDDCYDCFKFAEKMIFMESLEKKIENEYVSLIKDLEKDIMEEIERYEEFEKHKL